MKKNPTFSQDIYQATDTGLPNDFMNALPATFDACDHIIHQARNQIKVYDSPVGKLNIKKYCIPPIINRILYSLGWRTPKAKSTYQNALEIRKRGFLTPKPIGYRIDRTAKLINYSYFVSEQVLDMKPIGHWCRNKALISALAEYTAQLHLHGLMHKDYTPGNILYAEKDGKYSFMLVDINRFICQDKPIHILEACKNLMQPFSEDDMLEYFVAEYARFRQIHKDICTHHVLHLRHMRNRYDTFKAWLKKIPGARYLIGKPIK